MTEREIFDAAKTETDARVPPLKYEPMEERRRLQVFTEVYSRLKAEAKKRDGTGG
jgi:hypothetical protein